MGRSIRVLLVDDNKSDDFFEPLADLANNLIQCDLTPVHTWDKALKILDESPYEYHGLILDGKGQRTATSKSEDDSFLNVVLTALRDRARDGYGLPYVIYSGWADELKRYYADQPIFWKGKEEEEKMLRYLQNAIISNSEIYKCRQLYPDIFELFDLKILHSKYEIEMVDIVNLNYNNFTGNRETVFKSIRPILENSFFQLNQMNNTLIEATYLSKSNPNISGIIWHLAGSPQYNKSLDKVEFKAKQLVSLPLYYLMKMLQDVTSSAAMHHFDKKSSDYLIKSCTSALIEYLLWYKQFVKDNYIK